MSCWKSLRKSTAKGTFDLLVSVITYHLGQRSTPNSYSFHSPKAGTNHEKKRSHLGKKGRKAALSESICTIIALEWLVVLCFKLNPSGKAKGRVRDRPQTLFHSQNPKSVMRQPSSKFSFSLLPKTTEEGGGRLRNGTDASICLILPRKRPFKGFLHKTRIFIGLAS